MGRITNKSRDDAPKRAKKELTLEALLTSIAADAHGQLFLKWLFTECNVYDSSVVLTTLGEVDIKSTLYNEGRRELALSIRRKLPNHLRHLVEDKAETQTTTNEDKDNE